MVEQARQAQGSDARLEPGEIRLIAPAKVNLFLGIGSKRTDGYHEVHTVMHALMLHDTLRMKSEPAAVDGLQVEVHCIAREGLEPLDVSSEDNIAARAVRLLAQLTQRTENERVRIIIEKHIPAEAGLGGGSSDAAAALVGAAHLWQLPSNDTRIEQAARQIGVDVAFFLYGGCAAFDGTGDNFIHTLSPRSDALVLLRPDEGVATKEAYHAFDLSPQKIDANELAQALQARHAADVPLRNNLEAASQTLLPALADIRQWAFEQKGKDCEILMSGSGSTLFIICENIEEACVLASKAQACGWWARSTSFGPVRAAIIPSR